MIALLAALAWGGSAAAPPARACGHCLEDRIAAVYDHAVVTAARAHHQAVMFLGVSGLDPADPALATRRLRHAVEAAGVAVPGTVRVDATAAAVSFAFDPVRVPAAHVVTRVRADLARAGCTCDTLRVMRR